MSVEQQTIIEAMAHKRVFGPMFRRRWWAGDSWAPWKAFLKCLFALPPDKADLAIYRQCTGREIWPVRAAKEVWACCGRRAGKSRVAALLAVYLACFKSYEGLLAAGEWAVILCLSADRRQSRVTLEYIRGFIMGVPMLRARVTSEGGEWIELGADRVRIEVGTSSFKAPRGYSLAGVIADEICFWRSEDTGANPDREIVRAVRPGLITLGGTLVVISSPYWRRGEMWAAHQKHYGKDGDDVLFWLASSKTMNPTIDQAIIDEALESDPQAARSEYLGEFRNDVSGFIDVDVLKSCVVAGRYELPVQGKSYEAFIDAAGGSGGDSMTMAVAHQEGEKAVLDCVREVRPPFSPEAVTAQFAAELKRYRIFSAAADRFAGDWPREAFSKNGISLVPSEKTKSEIYLTALPLINSGQVELLDNPRLLRQLETLERRMRAGGRDVVDHASGLHDDLSNVACGSLVLVSGAGGSLGMIQYLQGIESGKYDPDSKAAISVTTVRPPEVPVLPVGACPKCGSACVIPIPANGRHCNSCGSQWWADGKGPEVTVCGFKAGRPQVYTRRVQ